MEEETGALMISLKWDESAGKWRGQDEKGPWAPGCQDAVPHTSGDSHLGRGEMHENRFMSSKTTRAIQMLGTDEDVGMRGWWTR